MTEIYTITTITNLNASKMEHRCIGFYYEKGSAITAVTINAGDMHETNYNYVVIETSYEGIYSYGLEEDQVWFEWNEESKSYKQIEKPLCQKNVCGYGIG